MVTESALLPCPSCRRHLFARNARCPFCGVHLALAQIGPALVMGAAMAAVGCRRTPDVGTTPDAASLEPTAESTAAASESASAPSSSFAGLGLNGPLASGAYGPPAHDSGAIGLIGVGASGAYGAPAPPVEVESSKVSTSVGAVGGEPTRVANAQRVLSAGRAGFRRCYFLGLQENPKQAGSVKLTMTVDPNGAVSSVSATVDGSVSDRVVECMKTRIRNMQLDPPTGGTPAKLLVSVKLDRAPPSD